MNKRVEDLMEMSVRKYMDISRETLAQTDAIYINDCKDKKKLEQQFESLNLSEEKRSLINDYIACTITVGDRYAGISYMAGMKDAIRIFVSLGLINGMEEL